MESIKPVKRKKWRLLIVLLAAALLIAAVLYVSLQIKLRGFERDMRVYLIEQGVAESEIVSIEAKRSMLPTYPVYVRFVHDPERVYTFAADEAGQGNFRLLDSRIPPQLVDREAQNARYAAYLEAYGFTDPQRLGMTDSALLEKGEEVWELAQQYWIPASLPQSFYGQRANTYKFSVDHPIIRERLGLHEGDRLNAHLTLIGDLVRIGYLDVDYAAAKDRSLHDGTLYTLKGERSAQ